MAEKCLTDCPQLQQCWVQPYQHLPATLLGRLARNTSFRGQGIGELLLLDALKRAHRHSKEIASIAVIVDAKDQRAVRFYKDFGFEEFPDSTDRLFIRMDTIGKLGLPLQGGAR